MNTGIVICLEQLSKVYACAEQLYADSASCASSPVLTQFYIERAIERMDFIDEISCKIENDNSYNGRTYEELFDWHKMLYGPGLLGQPSFVGIDALTVDEKALEICGYITPIKLREDIVNLLENQVLRIKSGILAWQFLNRLYD